MKKHIKKILNLVFPEEKLEKEKIEILLKNRNFLDRKKDIFSLLPYKNKRVSKSIKDLKFKNKISNAEFFGEILFENILDYLEDLKIKENFNDPILLTIPVSF